MNETTQDWRAQCAALGLDPQDVKNVSGRYDMHVQYNSEHGASVLPLQRWYKWYRVEKLSEGHAMLQPPPSGCSIGPDSNQAEAAQIVGEQEFLQLLELYRGS